MKELTCIVCPIGCALVVDEGSAAGENPAALTVTGNTCPRGIAYAREEICFPKRVVTATCAASGGGLRRIPVKTSAPCPKEKIPELLAEIYRTKVALPVRAGDIIIADWQGCGIDLVASRSAALCGV